MVTWRCRLLNAIDNDAPFGASLVWKVLSLMAIDIGPEVVMAPSPDVTWNSCSPHRHEAWATVRCCERRIAYRHPAARKLLRPHFGDRREQRPDHVRDLDQACQPVCQLLSAIAGPQGWCPGGRLSTWLYVALPRHWRTADRSATVETPCSRRSAKTPGCSHSSNESPRTGPSLIRQIGTNVSASRSVEIPAQVDQKASRVDCTVTSISPISGSGLTASSNTLCAMESVSPGDPTTKMAPPVGHASLFRNRHRRSLHPPGRRRCRRPGRPRRVGHELVILKPRSQPEGSCRWRLNRRAAFALRRVAAAPEPKPLSERPWAQCLEDAAVEVALTLRCCDGVLHGNVQQVDIDLQLYVRERWIDSPDHHGRRDAPWSALCALHVAFHVAPGSLRCRQSRTRWGRRR